MGLRSALQRLACAPCQQTSYRAQPGDQQVASPARVKISTDNEHQIEVKVKYNVNSRLKEQLYRLDLFMFFPEELEAVHSDLYEDLWQIVRLHTPKVPLSSLAKGQGLLAAIASNVQEIQVKVKAGEDVASEADTLVQQLRLHTCAFRAANRKATRAAVHSLQRLKAADGSAADADRALVAGLMHSLVAHSCEAIQYLQQICAPCQAAEMPPAVRQGWALADEFMLCEAKRAFMKLLRDIDKLELPKDSEACDAACGARTAGPGEPAGAPMDGRVQAGRGLAEGPYADELVRRASRDNAPLVLPFQPEGDDSPMLASTPAAQHPSTPFTLDGTAVSVSDVHSQQQAQALASWQHPVIMGARGTGSSQAHASMQDEASPRCHSEPVMERSVPSALQHDPPGPMPSHAAPPDLASVLSAARSGPLARWHALSVDVHGDPRQGQEASSLLYRSNSTPNKQAARSLPAIVQFMPSRFAAPSSAGAQGSQEHQQHQPVHVTPPGQPETSPAAAARPPVYPPRQSHNGSEQDPSAQDGCPQRSSFDASLLNRPSGGNGVLLPVPHQHATDPSMPSSRHLLQHARDLVSLAIYALRDESARRGYNESIIHDNDPHQNEAYTNRIKVLKHNARAVVSMEHQVQKPSMLLADLVGMTIAGLAMGVAVVSVYLAQRYSRNQYTAVYITIIVVGYMLKDRMKEWGKRYLQPVASWFGLKFPDRIVHVIDQRGVTVGRCSETSKMVGDGGVPSHVLRLRHHGQVAPLHQATKPERVMVYHKEMKVRWDRLDPRLKGVAGLDDVMRIDLGRLCRRMQPPTEPHYRLQTDSGGRMHVTKVTCARVYHVNVVLRIRTDTHRDDDEDDQKAMKLQSMRVVMSKDGIKRLEAADSPQLLAKPHAPLHMPSMPRLSNITPFPQLLQRVRRPGTAGVGGEASPVLPR